MSFGISVKSIDTAGGMQLGGGQNFFRIENQPVILIGDSIAGHGPVPHTAPFMAQGSNWMTLNGIQVCRQGHTSTCGHVSSGRNWFKIPG